MARIKTIVSNELIGGTDQTPVYPTTSTLAVYCQDLDGTQPEGRKKLLESRLQDIEKGMPEDIGRDGYVKCTIGDTAYLVPVFEYAVPDAPVVESVTGSDTSESRTVTFATSNGRAQVYYTTDGSTPTLSSLSGKVVTVNASEAKTSHTSTITHTIKAIAALNGSVSTVTTIQVTCARHLKRPNIFPASGSTIYDASRNITISTAVDDSDVVNKQVLYTLNGSNPLDSQNLAVRVYTGPFPITSTYTIKAVVKAEGLQSSDVVAKTIQANVKPISWGLVDEDGLKKDVVWVTDPDNQKLDAVGGLYISPVEGDYEAYFSDTDFSEDLYARFALRYPKSYGELKDVKVNGFRILDSFEKLDDEDYHCYIQLNPASQVNVPYEFYFNIENGKKA